MKKMALILFLLAILMAGQASADNRIMIMMDSIPNSLDTAYVPVGFENDLAIKFYNGFVLTASGDVTAKFEGAYKIESPRTFSSAFYYYICINCGQMLDSILVENDPYGLLPPLNPGPMDSIFNLKISISGGYGEICIDSTYRFGIAGDWLWDDGQGNANPTFNDGNGPHCMPYYYKCGDASRDMKVNVSDAVRIISYAIYGTFTPDPLIAADVNCDGTVNISDAVVIINYVFIGGYPPCDTNNDGIPDC
jgi:hypothetical protein